MEITSEATWAWHFLHGKAFDFKCCFFNKYKDIHIFCLIVKFLVICAFQGMCSFYVSIKHWHNVVHDVPVWSFKYFVLMSPFFIYGLGHFHFLLYYPNLSSEKCISVRKDLLIFSKNHFLFYWFFSIVFQFSTSRFCPFISLFNLYLNCSFYNFLRCDV